MTNEESMFLVNSAIKRFKQGTLKTATMLYYAKPSYWKFDTETREAYRKAAEIAQVLEQIEQLTAEGYGEFFYE